MQREASGLQHRAAHHVLNLFGKAPTVLTWELMLARGGPAVRNKQVRG